MEDVDLVDHTFNPMASAATVAALQGIGDKIVAEFAALAPKRSGRLAASANAHVTVGAFYNQSERAWCFVNVDAPYAAPVLFGHKTPNGGVVAAQNALRAATLAVIGK